MLTLAILRLSDSFSAHWPSIASASGLELAMLVDEAAIDQVASRVVIVAAGGEEHRLERLLLASTPRVPLAAVGARADHRLASGVVGAGASAYFALPDDLPLLTAWVRDQAEALRAGERAAAFAVAERGLYRFEGILGESPALHAALERASRVIPHANVTVLLAGETGTGKELLARALHYDGPRHAAPFVDVNCSAIPENLLESELFGHEKGSFTGATGSKPGLFELAHGGTIFLDEIGHLALPLQGKLLRVLEERTIRRVGGTRNVAVDVRVVAATHVDLAAAVRRGEFREDLFYRLNVVPIELPPLRARREDIVPLATHFLRRFAAEYGLGAIRLGDDASDVLRTRDWPGNIRELRNTIERAVLLGGASVLTARDVEAPPASAAHPPADLPFPAPLHEIVGAAVHAMVSLCGGNKSEAARRLKISRPRLVRLLGGQADEHIAESEPASTPPRPSESPHA